MKLGGRLQMEHCVWPIYRDGNNTYMYEGDVLGQIDFKTYKNELVFMGGNNNIGMLI